MKAREKREEEGKHWEESERYFASSWPQKAIWKWSQIEDKQTRTVEPKRRKKDATFTNKNKTDAYTKITQRLRVNRVSKERELRIKWQWYVAILTNWTFLMKRKKRLWIASNKIGACFLNCKKRKGQLSSKVIKSDASGRFFPVCSYAAPTAIPSGSWESLEDHRFHCQQDTE